MLRAHLYGSVDSFPGGTPGAFAAATTTTRRRHVKVCRGVCTYSEDTRMRERRELRERERERESERDSER